MKKIVSLVIAFLVLFSLSACSSTNKSSSSSSKKALTSSEIKASSESKAAKESKAAEESKAEAAAEAAASAAAAQEEADKTNPATYPTVPYDEMARNADNHAGEKIQFSGSVIQVMDLDDGGAALRVSTSEDGYEDIYYVEVDSSYWSTNRLLEDDLVTIYGTVYGLYSYDSTMGGKITVPAVNVVFYTR
ncbi:MAG: hypothetical protein LBV19_06115 [Streptococcaceae bacterium]|jgi:hypothetical protein|nr:hypothetical protein [Streptococcaceae bacterium]